MKEQTVKAFARFDRRNPKVYLGFRKLAVQALNSGKTRYGAWAIMNVLRWQSDTDSTGEAFKVRNDFISLYARKLAKDDYRFKTFFTFRPLKENE